MTPTDTYDLNLFPIPIRIVKIPQEYSTVCSFFDEQVHNPDTGGNSVDYGSHSSNSYILNEPECKNLANYILKKVKDYNDKILGYDVKKWQFSQTWVSHKAPGQQHIPHTHPNSVISGVFFYGEVVEKTEALIFQSPFTGGIRQNSLSVEKPYNKDNPNTWSGFQIAFEPGNMVLFPSWFSHSVPTNKTELVRKSVSMNIIPMGGVGDRKSLTELLFNKVI